MNGEASPRILVLYHSRHGNTRLLAEAIAAATGAALLVLSEGRRRGDQPALRACGLLFLGGPVHFGGPAAPLRALAHRPWPAEAAGAAMAMRKL